MGNLFTSLFDGIFPYLEADTECRLLMLGLDSAGKTTVLYKMKLGETLMTIPTIGFNIETITYKQLKMTVWDIGGQDRIRALWMNYFGGSHGLIFVVDSSNLEKFPVARRELTAIVNASEMASLRAVLVLANKFDLPGACTVREVVLEMDLEQVLKNHLWFAQSTCATTGEGLHEGMTWLCNQLREELKKKD
mmetsp:Transcript_7454/g.31581  ORF Transcript_7454/g.31581 Transcript_7454/m.31581 type:complete len:192 (-) Transcript_7454:1288-1863(-)